MERAPSWTYTEFNENISRNADGRYEVNVPWIPGRKLAETNEMQSRQRLRRVEKKLEQNMKLKEEYEKIVANQEETGVIEKVPDHPTGTRVFYIPHKPVIREDAATTKVRMVFDASAKPHYLANSINDCMYRGPPLQLLMWDILIRARMSTDILLGDIEKAFLQVGIKEEDRDAFRFLFKKDGKEELFRFTRVPFGAEASPFILGATLQYHCSQQPEEVKETVQALRENTYVDNLMQTGQGSEEMKRFKTEATQVLEEARFPVHKWESNLQELESDGMANPSKILGLGWDKQNDTIEVTIPQQVEEEHVTKKTILSHLGSIYDPLGILSPTTVEGKRIYREACDKKNGWNGEISERAQKGIPDDLKKPGWELVKDKETNLLKCKGRIPGYNPVYLEDTQFTRKLIQHVHTQIQHLGVANTMATLREEWWIPRLRTLVKKEVRDCNVCKVFAAKPYGAPTTSALPEFRTNVSRPFQYVGVDFAGPLKCKEGKTEEEKAYVLIFTCATSRAVHLELTRSQTAEEFQRKLNAFITRRTRPEKIVSDNAATFKATATWIRRIRKSEKLQNYLAQQEITW